VSSIEPDGRSGKINGGEEDASRFVIAGGDGAKPLELTEEVFSQVPRFVKLFDVVTPNVAIALRRKNRRFSRPLKWQDHVLVGVMAFVGKHRRNLHKRQKCIRAPSRAQAYPGAKTKACGIAERIGVAWIFALNLPLLHPMARSLLSFFAHPRRAMSMAFPSRQKIFDPLLFIVSPIMIYTWLMVKLILVLINHKVVIKQTAECIVLY
jgi:hypothetical protein